MYSVTPSMTGMTDGQIDKVVDIFRARLRKGRTILPLDAVQQVLGQSELLGYLILYLNKEGVVVPRKPKYLRVGMRVEMLEKGEIIDRGVVRSINVSDNPQFIQEIKVESNSLSPGEVSEFASFSAGNQLLSQWLMIFFDPFTDRRCYSQCGPVYEFRSTR